MWSAETGTSSSFKPKVLLCSQCPYAAECVLGAELLAVEPAQDELVVRFVSTAEGLAIIADGRNPEMCEQVLRGLGVPIESIAFERCG